jgi:hypothetical protein
MNFEAMRSSDDDAVRYWRFLTRWCPGLVRLNPAVPLLIRPWQALLLAAVVAAVAPAMADAEEPARYVPCPVPTDDPARYEGEAAPFRCHFAVADPGGLVVILREGWAGDVRRGPFGRQHASIDRGVSEEVIARVVSTVRPVEGELRRLHYIAEVRSGAESKAVWVVVDRAPSKQAPDTRPFGVITAFCRTAGGEPERCPDWVSGGTDQLP